MTRARSRRRALRRTEAVGETVEVAADVARASGAQPAVAAAHRRLQARAFTHQVVLLPAEGEAARHVTQRRHLARQLRVVGGRTDGPVRAVARQRSVHQSTARASPAAAASATAIETRLSP